MLDACVVEAKLLGMSVVRADASDAACGAYGVARRLYHELLEALPEAAGRASSARGALLARVSDDPMAVGVASQRQPCRERVQKVLVDFWREAARETSIAIAIDDADQIDPPSAALLSALAGAHGRFGITLILTRRGDRPAQPALACLIDAATRLELAPLAPEQTETLLRAVFGDV